MCRVSAQRVTYIYDTIKADTTIFTPRTQLLLPFIVLPSLDVVTSVYPLRHKRVITSLPHYLYGEAIPWASFKVWGMHLASTSDYAED